MTALLIILASLAAGAAAGRWWVLALPLLGIGLFALAHATLDPPWLQDTPVVAVALVSEASIAAGVALRLAVTRTGAV